MEMIAALIFVLAFFILEAYCFFYFMIVCFIVWLFSQLIKLIIRVVKALINIIREHRS